MATLERHERAEVPLTVPRCGRTHRCPAGSCYERRRQEAREAVAQVARTG